VLNLTGRLALALLCACSPREATVAQLGTGPSPTTAGPRPDVSISLRDGRFLHLAPLPFGALAGVIVGQARFDASGTRALVVAEFPGAGVHGDWRSANPKQAFFIDAQRRSVTQLTTDGNATSATWTSAGQAAIRSADGAIVSINVPDPQTSALPPARWSGSDEIPPGSAYVSGKSTDRLAVYKTTSGRYVVLQIGARSFRVAGVARGGAYAIIGAYLAWIDGQRHIAHQLSRFGPDNAEPLRFEGSVYGDALAPIRPLGKPVYQAAYRNGVAYFAFSFGVERIVAATSDLVNYWYPKLPHEPVFTVGDGLGQSPDGALYFFRPEEDVMLFTVGGHYVRAQMRGLDAARDPSLLFAAMRRLGGDRSAPPLSPFADALDAALLQWRFYPVGDASGERWIGSHLGRLLVGDRRGYFTTVQPPAFPFAVLGRTDDGRLWGASPTARGSPANPTEQSALWSSRDGVRWHSEAKLNGSPGAVGTHNGSVWVALTRQLSGLPSIFAARLDPMVPATYFATAGTYSGEQLAFAGLSTGFYLLWGATPGYRLDGEGGPLSGFRIDFGALADDSYVKQRREPESDASLPGRGDQIADTASMLEPTLALARRLPNDASLVLRTNAAASDLPRNVIVVGTDQERAFELKYAGRPFPIASVTVSVDGDTARVTRSIEYGPLRGAGSVERWSKDAAGAWRLSATLSRYSY